MKRIEKIRSKIASDSDALLVISESNRIYVSGFKSSEGYILISKFDAALFLDFRYYEMALIAKEKGEIPSEIRIVLSEKKRKDNIYEFLEKNDITNLLFEDKFITFEQYTNLLDETKDKCVISAIGSLFEECRASKDESEIQNIKHAQSITDAAFEHILPYLNPKITEIEVALELEYFMRKNGASGIAFETICVSGVKSALPHGRPDNKKLGRGFLTMDFGAKYNNYCSDMTRTVCIGNPTPEMKNVYATVLEAQERAFSEICAGVPGKIVDSAARDHIFSSGYKGCFGHSTGHSLGIEIHESPNFSPSSDISIPENAVLSVEPGIYIEGKFGVRIEDIVKISACGFENLTKSPKELIII